MMDKKNQSVPNFILYCIISLFLQLLAAFSIPFYAENLLSMCVSSYVKKKLVSTTVKFSVLETVTSYCLCDERGLD